MMKAFLLCLVVALLSVGCADNRTGASEIGIPYPPEGD